jgi:ureidoglycolate hydrolase
VQPLFDTHWPILLQQTYTQPVPLATGEVLYCDPKVVAGTFVTQYQSHSKNLDYVVSKNQAVDSGVYRVAIRHREWGFYLREMNHHPDSSQHFFHMKPSRPFMILLAPPNSILRMEEITAYVLNESDSKPRGLCIAPGVWHSPPIPLFGHVQEIFTQQTRSHNCILWDTLDKYLQWIHIK